jgi:hypothetical protein
VYLDYSFPKVIYFFSTAQVFFKVPEGFLYFFRSEDEIANILLKKKIILLLFI